MSGNGRGIAVNNKTKGKTFMRMFEIHEGPGAGVKKFRYVFVFEKVFNDSVSSGWESEGQVSAAVKTSTEKGEAMQDAASVSNGIWMYQLTGRGVALNITVKSTKYSPDDDLNKSS